MSMWRKFTQQRMWGWSPVLTAGQINLLVFLVGAVFAAIGAVLVGAASSAFEIQLEYSAKPKIAVKYPIKPPRAQDSLGGPLITSIHVGYVDVEVTRDMRDPMVFYELEGFYQNHRAYITSVDAAQLRDDQAEKPLESDPNKLSLCTDYTYGRGERAYLPCGLIAGTIFNDRFAIQQWPRDATSWVNVSLSRAQDDISWASDLKYGYKQADPTAPHGTSGKTMEQTFDMWLTEEFPPQVCVQRQFGVDSVPPNAVPSKQVAVDNLMQPIYVGLKIISAGPSDADKDREVVVADCQDHMKQTARCNFSAQPKSLGNRFECEGPRFARVPATDVLAAGRTSATSQAAGADQGWGVESAVFMGWMRPAPLPHFRKPLARMVGVTLKKGTFVRVHFVDQYDVSEFAGKKRIVIATSSWAGGRSFFLASCYLALGGACFICAAVMLYANVKVRRRPGDAGSLRFRN